MNKSARLLITFGISLLAPFMLAGFLQLHAQDVEITNERNFYIEAVDRIRVVETHTIQNNSTNSYLKQDNTETFIITHLKDKLDLIKTSVATAKIKADGKELSWTVEYKDDQALLSVKYPRRVGINDHLTFTLEYTNWGLIEETGALFDIYFAGLDKSTKFVTDAQTIDYKTNITINTDLFPETNFILPAPSSSDVPGTNLKHYYYTREAILGKTIWMQMGRKQFYHFKLVQKTDPTMQNNLGLQNDYQLVLPRDVENAEIYQKVYFDKMLPLPSRVEIDADGNIIAHFNVPSVEKGEISVEGYVEVGLTGLKVSESNSGILTDYKATEVATYLKAAEYWEVDNPEIKSVASSIKSTKTNIFGLISDTFAFVTNKINYSDVKRFGLNNRQGALATLHNGSGVCMEYSDLFLTLARAEGIPTRAVYGYGYDPKEGSSGQESHQWVASYIPGLDKWLDVDVTWGDSGKAAEGAYLNHFYTHMVTANPNVLPEVAVKSFGSNSNLSLPQYQITAETSVPKDQVLQTQSDLLAKYPNAGATGVTQWVLEIPLRIGALFGNLTNRDAISIALFTAGFTLIVVPLVWALRSRIDFGDKKPEPVTSA